VPDPDYGQDIRAYVVVKPGARLESGELRAWCLAELGRYKTPREFRFVAELPKGPSGKVQRLKLAEGA
jgi:long-chain acyl-CoA synthetase